MTDSDITSPTVLLTGPTSGIGAAMLNALTRHPSHPRLVLLARDEAALERDLLMARTRGARAEGIRVDLSDFGSVQNALEELSAKIDAGRIRKIDVAVLNAGAQFRSRRETGAQGLELTFTVNVVAQHLVLRGVEPLLAPRAHVVLMGSSTHRGKRASFNLVPDPVWADPAALAVPDPPVRAVAKLADERNRGGIAYATSKLALVTLSHEWAARMAAADRRLNTYDPGLVAGTGLGKDMPGHMYWVWRRLMPAMRVLPGATTPAIAARHAVELALGDAHAHLHDGYVEIGRMTKAEQVTFDEARREQLWTWLERTVADWLPQHARVSP